MTVPGVTCVVGRVSSFRRLWTLAQPSVTTSGAIETWPPRPPATPPCQIVSPRLGRLRRVDTFVRVLHQVELAAAGLLE